MSLIATIWDTGRAAEPAPPVPEHAPDEAVEQAPGPARVRHLNAGSCNGCEVEIGQAFSPVYDAERCGFRLVASPRHADALVVTGPVTRNMADALVRTYESAPRPCSVVALGDCALDCGMFAGGHGVAGPVSDFVPVDVPVPGCPPPETIVAALRRASGR
jgi:Ni,Fe-hydrogenase III small subunit